jgi:hypothetical protein
VSDAEGDLNATREDVISDAQRLVEIEREKSGLDPTDPRLADLSDEAERVATRVRSKTAIERELVDEVADAQRE